MFTKPAKGQNVASCTTPAWCTDFISGTSTLKRDGLRQSLQDAQVDRFDALLAYRTSRSARNRADAIRHKAALKKLGEAAVFVSQNPLPSRKHARVVGR